MNDTTLGIISAAVPLVIIGFFALRRLPWIFAFFIALVAVGIGYLTTTETMKEFGHKVRTTLPAGIIPEHKRAEEAPAEGGAMKALPPATAPESSSTQTPAAAPTPPATPAPEATPPSPPAAESTPAPAPAAPAPQPDNSATPPAAPAPAPTTTAPASP